MHYYINAELRSRISTIRMEWIGSLKDLEWTFPSKNTYKPRTFQRLHYEKCANGLFMLPALIKALTDMHKSCTGISISTYSRGSPSTNLKADRCASDPEHILTYMHVRNRRSMLQCMLLEIPVIMAIQASKVLAFTERNNAFYCLNAAFLPLLPSAFLPFLNDIQNKKVHMR